MSVKRHFQPVFQDLTDMEWSFIAQHRSSFRSPRLGCKVKGGATSKVRSDPTGRVTQLVLHPAMLCCTHTKGHHALLHPSTNQTALRTISLGEFRLCASMWLKFKLMWNLLQHGHSAGLRAIVGLTVHARTICTTHLPLCAWPKMTLSHSCVSNLNGSSLMS